MSQMTSWSEPQVKFCHKNLTADNLTTGRATRCHLGDANYFISTLVLVTVGKENVVTIHQAEYDGCKIDALFGTQNCTAQYFSN